MPTIGDRLQTGAPNWEFGTPRWHPRLLEQRHAAHPGHRDPAAELAARAGMTKQAMAAVERRGYIQRTTGPADRRAKIIEFTDEGWAIARLALSALGELDAEIAGRLGEPPVRQLRGPLLEILDRPACARRAESAGPAS